MYVRGEIGNNFQIIIIYKASDFVFYTFNDIIVWLHYIGVRPYIKIQSVNLDLKFFWLLVKKQGDHDRMLNLNDCGSQLSGQSNSLHLSPVLQFKKESLYSCLSWILWFVLINLFNLRPTPKILKKWLSHVVMLAFVESALLLVHLEIEQAPSALLQSSHWVGLLFDLSATFAPLLILLASGFSGMTISNRWSMRSQDENDPQTTQSVFLQVGVHFRLSSSSNAFLGASSRRVITLPVWWGKIEPC